MKPNHNHYPQSQQQHHHHHQQAHRKKVEHAIQQEASERWTERNKDKPEGKTKDDKVEDTLES
jgi:hypothetical protein